MTRAMATAALTAKDNEIEVKLAEVDVKLAEAELANAGPGMPRQVLELKIEQAKLKLERAQTRTKGRLSQVEADQRAKVAVLEQETLRQREAEAELKQCELLAPIDGIVLNYVPATGRFAGGAIMEPGAQVREGQKLLRVAGLKQFVVATRIHEAVISTVRNGQAARVRIDAFPDRQLRGKVTQVSPVAAPADWRADVKVYPVTVAIDDPPPRLKPDMTAEVQIVTGERKGVVQVPIKAIVRVGRDRFCFVKSGTELVERQVVTGAAGATSVEITDGLKEGDLVVTDPPALLGRQ